MVKVDGTDAEPYPIIVTSRDDSVASLSVCPTTDVVAYAGIGSGHDISSCSVIVTPQVFSFHNCIAFHKHEHSSSHCVLFCLQHEYATCLMCLFHKMIAYEM
jgi:hypothetical protein